MGELSRDFKRLAQSIDHQYQHVRLMPKAKKAESADEAEKGLANEHAALDQTLSMTDEVISSATATRDMLVGQRGMLTGVGGKVGSLAGTMPGIDQLIGKISDRKTKEQLVLALTVACCCFFTMWYKFF